MSKSFRYDPFTGQNPRKRMSKNSKKQNSGRGRRDRREQKREF